MTITKDNPATINTIKDCIGKTVLDIFRIQSYFNDKEDTDGFGDLEISFNDNSNLTLTGVGDAESIRADNKKADVPEPFKVTDHDVCSWERIDLKKIEEWKKLIGQTLQTAEVEWNIYENQDDRLIGCILRFETDFITFYETGSDANKFFVNELIPSLGKATKIEKLN